MKINNNLIGLYISVALAGLASIPNTFFKEKWLPYVLACIFLILSLFFLIKFLYDKFSFRLILSNDNSLKRIDGIYNNAMKNGGKLYHTYIAPIESLQIDLLKQLSKISENELSIKLLLYTDDPLILHKSIYEILSNKNSNLNIEIIVPDSIDFVPKFIWYILPRINILSYHNDVKNISTSSLSVVRLFSKNNNGLNGNPESPTINFVSNRKKLFNEIENYFKAFNYGHCNTYHSLSEYEKTKTKLLSQAKYKSFLAHILHLCNNSETGILHISLFGQYALYEKGIYKIGDLKIDYDIDILLVCEQGKSESVRFAINEELKKLDFSIKIIWGPINEDFYGNRSNENIYIDIELFEEGDEYYLENSLLGFSIIPSCLSIFKQNEMEHRLYKLLPLPDSAIEKIDRFSIVLNSRKGLTDFASSIIKFKGRFDPIRVISHILRNTAWAITGHFEPTYDKMFEAITDYDEKAIDVQLVGKVYNMVKHSERFTQEEQYQVTFELLSELINYLKKQIEEKTKANNVYKSLGG